MHQKLFEIKRLLETINSALQRCDNLEMVDDEVAVGDKASPWINHGHQLADALLPVLETRHIGALLAGCVPEYANQDSSLAQETFETGSAQALVEISGQGLLSLYTTVKYQLASKVVQQILCHDRDLASFGGSVLPELLFSDILQSSWSCRFITVLMVTIAGIPRPDVKLDYQNASMAPGTSLHTGTMEESRKIQREVYRQLGSLVF
ncbi:hypothetical protein BGZ96_007593 [Linnemannia gamsii]|uniref:Uncharacterized protein n=1 Tax=Linnemannia gamsii TaxID=64522 RepID=A0ABQ7K0Z9_9FUNG|nr:hypothetical protein BGZ96_007593 [Linnemannia gamsii]